MDDFASAVSAGNTQGGNKHQNTFEMINNRGGQSSTYACAKATLF